MLTGKGGYVNPKRVGNGHGLVAYTWIDLCDNPYAYMTVRYRPLRPDFGILEFRKPNPKR